MAILFGLLPGSHIIWFARKGNGGPENPVTLRFLTAGAHLSESDTVVNPG